MTEQSQQGFCHTTKSLSGIHSEHRVHLLIIVKIHLLPSDGGLTGPIKAIQTTENRVPITGNEPNGAFTTVPFETFLWHISHDDTYINTKLLIPGQ